MVDPVGLGFATDGRPGPHAARDTKTSTHHLRACGRRSSIRALRLLKTRTPGRGKHPTPPPSRTRT
jgi:hypothetical protein